MCIHDNLNTMKSFYEEPYWEWGIWFNTVIPLPQDRVAQSAGIGGLDPSIAKDLIDSEDPKHTLFCREIAFVAIYALFRDDISILW